MRIAHLFVVMLALGGVSAIPPATAATALAKAPAVAAPFGQPSDSTASADQYRNRYGNRGYRGGYGYRANRGYRGYRRGYYRPSHYAYRPYRWRDGRLVCRTSWRWGRPHRVCFRRW